MMRKLVRSLHYRANIFLPIAIASAIIPWASMTAPMRAALALPLGILIAWCVEWYADPVTTVDDMDFCDTHARFSIGRVQEPKKVIDGFREVTGSIVSADECLYCVCGPAPCSGKSTMAMALARAIQARGAEVTMVNADSRRKVPADYVSMVSEEAPPMRMIGPLKREEVHAAVQTVRAEGECCVVIDHGPLTIDEAKDTCAMATMIVVLGPRQISRGHLEQFWNAIRKHAPRAFLVFNTGAKNNYSYAYYYRTYSYHPDTKKA